jgi:hypothetical protein
MVELSSQVIGESEIMQIWEGSLWRSPVSGLDA